MNATTPYTLTLRTQDRLLVVGIMVFFILFIGLAARSIWDGPWLALLFVLVWAAFAVWFFGRTLRSPIQITVLPGGRVCFRNWFNRQREVRMGEIEEIRLQANLLTIKTTECEYTGLSGFDGLHRFVNDVAQHNSFLVTKGI